MNLILPKQSNQQSIAHFRKETDFWGHVIQPNIRSDFGYNSYECNITRKQKIGSGHFGDVYLCSVSPKNFMIHDLKLSTRFAVKVFESGEDGRQDWNKEKKINEAISVIQQGQQDNECSQFIAKYFGFFTGNWNRKKQGLFLEYVEGTNLQCILDTGNEDTLSIQKKAKILSQVAQGLNWIHSHNCIHRDLKPDNVIYNSSKNTAKIIDLGYALDTSDLANDVVDSISYGEYCAPSCTIPIEVFLLEQKIKNIQKNSSEDSDDGFDFDSKKWSDEARREVFQTSYDMPSLGIIALQLFFGNINDLQTLLKQLIYDIEPFDLKNSISGRRDLYNLIQNSKTNIKNEEILKKIGNLGKFPNLIEFLNNQLPTNAQLTPNQTCILRIILLACFNEQPDSRPTALTFSYLFNFLVNDELHIHEVTKRLKSQISQGEYKKISTIIEKHCAKEYQTSSTRTHTPDIRSFFNPIRSSLVAHTRSKSNDNLQSLQLPSEGQIETITSLSATSSQP